jgi:hypothetical protein
MERVPRWQVCCSKAVDNVVCLQFVGLDLVKEAGPYTPLVKEFTFVPSGPTMVIELISKKDNAMLNAIEVYAREVVNTQEGKLAANLLLMSVILWHPCSFRFVSSAYRALDVILYS